MLEKVRHTLLSTSLREWKAEKQITEEPWSNKQISFQKLTCDVCCLRSRTSVPIEIMSKMVVRSSCISPTMFYPHHRINHTVLRVLSYIPIPISRPEEARGGNKIISALWKLECRRQTTQKNCGHTGMWPLPLHSAEAKREHRGWNIPILWQSIISSHWSNPSGYQKAKDSRWFSPNRSDSNAQRRERKGGHWSKGTNRELPYSYRLQGSRVRTSGYWDLCHHKC